MTLLAVAAQPQTLGRNSSQCPTAFADVLLNLYCAMTSFAWITPGRCDPPLHRKGVELSKKKKKKEDVSSRFLHNILSLIVRDISRISQTARLVVAGRWCYTDTFWPLITWVMMRYQMRLQIIFILQPTASEMHLILYSLIWAALGFSGFYYFLHCQRSC